MKKALAIVMALVIALSMSAMAFAAAQTCEACGKTFDNEMAYSDHLKSCSAAAALKKTCGFCNSTFGSDEALLEHQKTCSKNTTTTTEKKTDPNKVYCDVCENYFANEGEYVKHLALCNDKLCPKCKRTFADEKAYNEHVAACTYGDQKDYVDLTIKDILTMIIDLVKTNAGQWDAIESVVIRLVDFIENIGTGLIPAADVNGAVADLEAALADFEIPGINDLLNQLKAKIKAMYAGEKATTVATTEATTEAEAPVDTGSASVGIAAFAAISVAAAAAYVCTKKKA